MKIDLQIQRRIESLIQTKFEKNWYKRKTEGGNGNIENKNNT